MDSLPTVIRNIRNNLSNYPECYILVVDDGSTDETREVAKREDVDILLCHNENRGIALAYKTAIRMALYFGADIVCTIDADGQFNPKDIKRLVEAIRGGEADLVIGSRFIDSRNTKNVPIVNRLANKMVSIIISMLSGKRLKDTESGFRALSRESAQSLELLGKVSFSNDMILDLVMKNHTIFELPVNVKYFQRRVSRVIKGFLRYGFKTLGLIIMKKISLHFPLTKMIDYNPPVTIVYTSNHFREMRRNIEAIN